MIHTLRHASYKSYLILDVCLQTVSFFLDNSMSDVSTLLSRRKAFSPFSKNIFTIRKIVLAVSSLQILFLTSLTESLIFERKASITSSTFFRTDLKAEAVILKYFVHAIDRHLVICLIKIILFVLLIETVCKKT